MHVVNKLIVKVICIMEMIIIGQANQRGKTLIMCIYISIYSTYFVTETVP